MLDFPTSPTLGQVFGKWTWDGTAWALPNARAGGDGFTFVGEWLPTATKQGDTWFETDTGNSYVWVDDGNSTQWVQFAPGRKYSASQISFAPTWGWVTNYPTVSSVNLQAAIEEVAADTTEAYARGIEVMGVVPSNSGLGVAAGSYTTLTNTLSFTPRLNRRYRLFFRVRAVTSSGYIWMRTLGSNNIPTHEVFTFVGGSYSHLDMEIIFEGTNVPSTYYVQCYAQAAATLYSGDQQSSKFYIEDVGPVRQEGM